MLVFHIAACAVSFPPQLFEHVSTSSKSSCILIESTVFCECRDICEFLQKHLGLIIYLFITLSIW